MTRIRECAKVRSTHDPMYEPVAPIRTRLARETGRLEKTSDFTVALAYPSPYRTGMSSLGYLQIYKAIQREPGMACVRAFLPDDEERAPLTYEALRPLSDHPVIAFSVAYELELAGVVRMLEASGLAALREERGEGDPFILAGGPLTFSNPLPARRVRRRDRDGRSRHACHRCAAHSP